ncbi:type B carboxylesterase domain containing protein [Rhodotorula toruloides]|uniref:Type B carboxylesterase domain containing protein n=1 Tax=Rhodotorula toruloides TaxID=5286 RepID=A0A511KMC6_RHOTO|nr:type B carboxylesterase domain containing protein [Rhodotorula toruloides]
MAQSPSRAFNDAPIDSPTSRRSALLTSFKLHNAPLRLPALLLVGGLTAVAIGTWPFLALGTLIPLVGLVSLPTLLTCSLAILLLLPVILYLLLAQPGSPSPPLLPYFPVLSPLRCIRLTLFAFQVLLDAYRCSLIPLLLDGLTKRILILGGRDTDQIIRENIVYIPCDPPAYPEARRLDVYRPELPPSSDADASLAPVIVLLPSPVYRLAHLRSFPAPSIALRLRQRGICVVVPSLASYSSTNPDVQDGRAVERMVAETREVVKWVGENVERYGGDRERVWMMGCGAGAHVAALTFVQSAVVAARNAFAAGEAQKADERKKKEGKVTVDDSRGSSLLGAPAGAEECALKGQASGLSRISPPEPTFDDSEDDPVEAILRQSRSADVQPREQGNLALEAQESDVELELPSGIRSAELFTLESLTSTYNKGPAADVHANEPETSFQSLASFRLPRSGKRVEVRGLLLVGGTYDVVKQGRWEERQGVEEISALLRVCDSSTRDILQACPAHLLYAASPLVSSAQPPSFSSLLPSQTLLIHGGADYLSPYSQSVLFRNLLVGVGCASEDVKVRLFKKMSALGGVESLMHGTQYSALVSSEVESVVLADTEGDFQRKKERRKGKGRNVDA